MKKMLIYSDLITKSDNPNLSEDMNQLINLSREHNVIMAKLRIADIVHNHIDSVGLSKEDFGKLLNFEQSKLTKFLSGSLDISLDMIIRIEEVLGIDIISNALYPTREVQEEYGKYDGPYVTVTPDYNPKQKGLNNFFKFLKEEIKFIENRHSHTNLYLIDWGLSGLVEDYYIFLTIQKKRKYEVLYDVPIGTCGRFEKIFRKLLKLENIDRIKFEKKLNK